jgi:hypothetical protein
VSWRWSVASLDAGKYPAWQKRLGWCVKCLVLVCQLDERKSPLREKKAGWGTLV